MKVEVNIKGLWQQLFKSMQSTHNLYYKVIINLPYFTPARILRYTNPDDRQMARFILFHQISFIYDGILTAYDMSFAVYKPQ